MEKIALYVFVIAWTGAALAGFLNPRSAIKAVPTQFKIMGMDPDNPPRGILIFTRIGSLAAFIIGAVLLFALFTGKMSGGGCSV